MSGTVGIFRRDGAPVERPLLCALTKFLSFRGPDAQEVWSDGPVGFGHTMLRTTREAANERQPASLDGRFWITADVRLDCRSELIEALQQAGRRFDAAQITDPELILHAYATWGEGCVDKLRGDFAFALWDARERRLFCSRDHFGIKPFFYVAKENQFLFSNTLNCLRAHPDVSDELNDAAIGDFLLFGLNCDVATTTFQDIQRLPPAHLLVVSAEGLRTQKYWSPPIDGRIRYKRDEEYVEHFLEIFKAAVADRLRTDRVGIFLSGGLDSGSIAAMARELSGSPAGAKELRAYTTVIKSPFVDEEDVYARQTARFLDIPLDCSTIDGLPLFDRWQDPNLTPVEPLDWPFFSSFVDSYKLVSSECRTVFSGEGGDHLMYFQMLPYAMDLLRRREWRSLATELSHFLWIRPFPWKGIRFHFLRLWRREWPVFPEWIEPNFAKRFSLEKRWECEPLEGSTAHPLLPKAYATLTNPFWMLFFELEDPASTRCCLETRYPFHDVRMVNYLLSIPPFPWLFEKRIIRQAARARLPEIIRLRPKTPLPKYPLVEGIRSGGANQVSLIEFTGTIEAYIDPSRLPRLTDEKNPERMLMIVRTLGLNLWLQSAAALRYKLNPGVQYA